MDMINFLYHYKAIVKEIYDGDTITNCTIDLGFGVFLTDQKIRLYGIDTPEIRGEERKEGLVARDWMRERLLGEAITLRTIKDKTGKYGRWLGIVIDKDGKNINEELVKRGLAVVADY